VSRVLGVSALLLALAACTSGAPNSPTRRARSRTSARAKRIWGWQHTRLPRPGADTQRARADHQLRGPGKAVQEPPLQAAGHRTERPGGHRPRPAPGPVPLPVHHEPLGPDARRSESSIASFNHDGYVSSKKYLTGNLVLWPRMVVPFISDTALKRLSPQQRHALTRATAATFEDTMSELQSEDGMNSPNSARQDWSWGKPVQRSSRRIVRRSHRSAPGWRAPPDRRAVHAGEVAGEGSEAGTRPALLMRLHGSIDVNWPRALLAYPVETLPTAVVQGLMSWSMGGQLSACARA